MYQGGEPFTLSFLKNVIDAVPEATMVVDLDYRIILANKTARESVGIDTSTGGCLRCYQISHHRDAPCEGDDEPCPLREAAASKAPVTVTHKHFTASGRLRFVEITAVPICDERGEVVQIVESQRDVSEHKRLHRLLEISNRHVKMKPMLDEFVAELRNFVDCSALGIRILDERGFIEYRASDGFSREFLDLENALSVETQQCMCVKVVMGQIDTMFPCFTENGSFHVNNLSRFLDTLTGEQKAQLRGACHKFGYESIAIVPVRSSKRILGLIHVVDQRENEISGATVETLERVALQLGTAIQRVQMEEALRTAHADLETKVQRRTEQLLAANKALQEEITERENAEAVLQKQAQVLRQIRDAVVSTDLDGFVTSWNKGAERLLGYRVEEALGKHVSFIYSEYWQDVLQEQIIEPLKEMGEHQIEVRLRRKSGEEFHADLSLSLLRDAAGKITGMIACGTDISQRKRLEQEVLHVGAQEQQRIGRELHDGLGQELTGLGYLAKSLHGRLITQDSPETETAAELAQGIPQTLAQLQGIVKDLVPLDVGPDTLLPALQNLAANVEERSGVSCRVEGHERSPLEDDDTAIHIYRIAQEAINNAVKHGAPRHVTVSLGAHDNRVTLQVRDDGKGIDPRVEEVSGSGLRIMRYRARVIGATLDVQSTFGEGTLVVCTLRKEKRHE